MKEILNPQAVLPVSLESLETKLTEGKKLDISLSGAGFQSFCERLRTNKDNVMIVAEADLLITPDENPLDVTHYQAYQFDSSNQLNEFFGLPKISFYNGNIERLILQIEGVIALAKAMGYKVALLPGKTLQKDGLDHLPMLKFDLYLVEINPTERPIKLASSIGDVATHVKYLD